MNLLIDIGNSRLKWAVEQDGSIDGFISLDYRHSGFLADLGRQWQSIDTPKQIAIASVADQSVREGVVSLLNGLWPGNDLLLPRSSRQAFGVTSAYDNPEKLGIDRWLALIGAYHNYSGHVCIVDCGTAITVDVLRSDGRHLGGLISPGLLMMQKALAANTADLPFESKSYRMSLATETLAGIANGVFAAATGMIDNVMRRLASDCQLILTGGDADKVTASLSAPAVVDKSLVFKGLSVFCSGNQNT
ncbi:MAG: type III pantothenate kinase [Gammaproteobacteria bacterium]